MFLWYAGSRLSLVSRLAWHCVQWRSPICPSWVRPKCSTWQVAQRGVKASSLLWRGPAWQVWQARSETFSQ